MQNGQPNDISNLITHLVKWSLETIPFSIKICVIVHKNKREDLGFISICLNDVFWQKLQATKAILH